MSRAVRAGLAVALGAAGMGLAMPTAANAVTEPIDIRVEHSLYVDDGRAPRVLEALGVTAGPGPEVTVANEVSNDSEWGGNVLVDVDPEARTLSVEVEDQNCYDGVVVTITSDEIASVTHESGSIFSPDDGDPEVLMDVAVAGGVVTLSWNGQPDFCSELADEGTAAVFSYELVDRALTVDPAEGEPGALIGLAGVQCDGNEVVGSVSLDGAEVAAVEAEVADDGTWSAEVDTAGFADGTYTVSVTCQIFGDPIFDYDEATFVLATAEVPDETEVPDEADEDEADSDSDADETDEAPAAQPVTAEPNFTG